MEYDWKILDSADGEAIKELSDQLNQLDPALCNILLQRKVDSYDRAKKFFRPQFSDLHDPFLMKDMMEAVTALTDAIETEERILVYGDYDVDGCTSVALMYLFLKRFYPHVGYYIPDRNAEGYGVSFKGIDYAEENDYSLIISLDCGIKAVDRVEYAKDKGIRFIICDHHTPGETLPDAVAILDPKREDCSYPFKELSGCGVGFKLIQAFILDNDREMSEAYDLLDLCAVSIAADIVPVTDENRTLAYFGLEKLNNNPTAGLQSLMKLAELEQQEITISDIVFKLAPRINAAGRIGHAHDALKLLISNDYRLEESFAAYINSINIERKKIDKLMTKEAIEQVRQKSENSDLKTNIVFNPSWHKGVVGIVASRLIEHFYRPTIVLTEDDNGLVTGSARSVSDFSIYEPIEACQDLLKNFGGHKFAAGVTLPKENLEKFMEQFEQEVAARITEQDLRPCIDIDSYVDFDEINNPRFLRVLKQFAPFGPENSNPVFMTRAVYDTGYARTVGKENQHLKMTLISKNSSIILSAIAFNLGHKLPIVRSDHEFNICYTIEENKFNKKKSIQLNIKDIVLNETD